MPRKNIEQFSKVSKKEKVKWTTKEIKDANSISRFQQINPVFTNLIYLSNAGIILFAVSNFIAENCHMELPDFANIFTTFKGNPICAINALFLCVLTLGHDDYYHRTEKMMILSDYKGLQWIDFVIKVSLLLASILQCMEIEFFIGICCYGYILTFIRAWYLKKNLDESHPLFDEVQEKWYPHNIVHNLIMFFWTLFYYGLLKTKLIYKGVCYIVKMKIDFANPEVDKLITITGYIYIIIFNIYWINRVCNKKIIKKNESFDAKYEKELEGRVEEYYEKADG